MTKQTTRNMNTHTNKHTIFWADDDQDDLLLFREVVEAHAPNHTVVEFMHGKELIEALLNGAHNDLPCLIVLDMNMPVLGGRDTLAQIKAEPALKHIPIVVFTTSSSDTDKEFCKQLNTQMITKPISYDHLENTIKKIINLCDEPVRTDIAA